MNIFCIDSSESSDETYLRYLHKNNFKNLASFAIIFFRIILVLAIYILHKYSRHIHFTYKVVN